MFTTGFLLGLALGFFFGSIVLGVTAILLKIEGDRK